MSTPRLVGASASALFSVSCSSVKVCLALGSYQDRRGTVFAFAIRLARGGWVAQPPALATEVQLFDVSCPTDLACVAVGAVRPKHPVNGEGGDYVMVAERWSPAGWAVLGTPSTGVDSHSYFAAVSCTSASSCMAVGYSDGGANSTCAYPELAVAERFNGRAWAAPRGWDPCFGALSDVSCVSPSACMVVGGSDLAASSLPIVSLIGARHGGEFNISNDPTNQALNTENWGRVSCTSPTACEAIVGDTTLVALADRVWSTEPQYPANMTLMNVSCASSTCVAIGRYHNRAASITPVYQPGPIKLFQTRPAAARAGASQRTRHHNF